MAFDIRVQGLKKRFGRVTAVDGLDLGVDEGEMMGLIGPDGAGKTTLLRILCGLFHADAGECRVGGLNVTGEIRAIRSIVGYMPQRFSLYPDLTVSENLRFFADLFQVGSRDREDRMVRLLEFSRLGPFMKRRASALSGGMKQKLALSCTLIHTPRILLLDEPTTGVDPLSRREFWTILNELRSEGVTLLITTPYMDEAARCDRVAFIYKGRILLTGKPEEIAGMYQKTLLEVRCQDNVQAARLLDGEPRLDSIHIFGDRIHVGGSLGADSLEKSIRRCLESGGIRLVSIRKIRAGIEDVFVDRLK